MNVKWLEDFLALVNYGNFTRAAQSRHITQPALSRRIRSLEHWLGVELVDRNTYPLRLTPVGTEYLGRIQRLLGDVHKLRADIGGWASSGRRVVVATLHSLSVSFCPAWYERCRQFAGETSFSINALNLYECIEIFLAAQCDLLLCYVTPTVADQLNTVTVEKLDLGQELLIPVCATDESGNAIIDIEASRSVPMIGFPAESFFGDLIRSECMPDAADTVSFNVIYETALSEGVRSMTLNGAGMAWLPAGLVQSQIDDGRLVKVAGLRELRLDIALFKHRAAAQEPLHSIWRGLQTNEH